MAHENHLLGGHVSSQEGTFYSLGTKSSYTGCVCVFSCFAVSIGISNNDNGNSCL